MPHDGRITQLCRRDTNSRMPFQDLARTAASATMAPIALPTSARLSRPAMPELPSLGFADTLEVAKRDFAATWRRWLAMHGKDEHTHRPFYGRSVDLGQDETPTPDFPEQG